MLCGRPVNIVWMLYQCCIWTKILMLLQLVWMLWQCCPQCWEPILRQHSGNVVWTLSQYWCPILGFDIETTLRQHCVNVVSTLAPNLVVLGPEWQLHSKLNFPHICSFNTHLYMGTITSTNMSNATYHSSWVNRQTLNFQEISSGGPHGSVCLGK